MDSTNYLEWNKNSHETIVCIHGFADNASMFVPLQKIFPGKRILSINLPMNLNRTATYNIPELSKYVSELLDNMHLTQYSLIGFSLGGLIATELAWQDPRAKNLVLLNSFPSLSVVKPVSKYLFNLKPLLKQKPVLYLYSRTNTNQLVRRIGGAPQLPSKTINHMRKSYISVFGTLLNCLSYQGVGKYKKITIPKTIILFKDDKALSYKTISKYARQNEIEIKTVEHGGHNATDDYWVSAENVLRSSIDKNNPA